MRLLNSQTGVTVNVSDATAARLGREWVPAEKEAPPAPTPTKPKSARRPSSTK